MESDQAGEGNQLSDNTDPGYTDASSLPVAEPSYIDASSLPVPAANHQETDEETDEGTSTSSSSSYLDAASSKSLIHQDSGDPPYVDAYSTDTFYDPQEQEKNMDAVEKTAENNTGGQDSSEVQQSQANRHVYFELEKLQESEEAEDADRFRRQTIALANVKVAERAKLFEAGCHNAYASETKDTQAGNEDVIYDVPPALQPGAGNHHASDSGGVPAGDEDIYEITFGNNDDQSDQAKAFQSSAEGSGTYEVVGKPLTVPKPATYELAAPMVKTADPKSSSIASSASDLSGSGGFMRCKQGAARQELVQGVMPTQQEIESEYNRLQFNRNSDGRPTPEEMNYHSLNRFSSSSPRDPSTNEPLYEIPENAKNRRSWASSDCTWSDGSWGSSEFEDDENEEGYLAGPETPAPTKPLPRKPRHSESADSLQKLPGLLNKLKPSNSKSPVYEDSDAISLPVIINSAKHPPPELPPPPPGLSESRKKCRCVVELTISSERSYIESLERIVQEYEKPILEVITNPKSHVRAVCREAREILNHHKMFQIELADTVKKWDSQEKIGDIFTASFTKSMLVDAYSVYVNNFAAGMDEIRTAQQNKPSFEEFLKMKEKSSYDRLSIFGLMVKPVQRFPQFIMLLQDIIKYTPHSHHDRRALQLALTELENVTHKLNERKRLSEQYFQAKQTMQLLPRQLPSQVLSSRNMEKPRRLIRFDNFDQIDGETENMKSSSRRLILMDDLLVCVKVGLKDQDGFMMERYRLKWAMRLCDIELKDAAMTPDMRNVVKMDPKRLNALATQLEKPAEDPFHLYGDLRDMLHDLTVLSEIVNLMKSLRRSYQGYNMSEELFNEVASDLQRMIQIKDEQLRLVSSCSVILVDNSKADKPHYVMQTPTASLKNEWSVDFNMAKLALEKQNQPGWDRSPLAGNEELEPLPAFFMKCVPVDVPRHFTKVKCATSVFMPSVPQVSGIGVQHLWVCTSTSSRGQVSIVSLHNTRPALTESFKACDCDVICVEVVSGCGQETQAARFLFSEDTVWMANTHHEMVIFPLSSTGGSTATRDPLAVVRVPGQVTSIKFVDERLFCGLDDGAVLVYSRNDEGEWCIKASRTLQLGRSPVRCQLVVEDDLWIGCGHHIHVVEIDSLEILRTHTVSGDHETTILQVVRTGVGVWVAFQNSAAVRLFHLETMENLQEMSVANTINRVLAEKSGSADTRDCVVTCITASTGLLWIGTSVGLILTLPLPRLSDGVPLYRGRPSVAYHAHRGPVRFIIPVYCSGSIMELHRNSSLRSNLRARPSIRNRKREIIETEGLAEDKLLSSGTELEASQTQYSKPVKKGDRTSKDYMEVLPPKPSELPAQMNSAMMKSQAGRKLLSLKRFKKACGDSRSSSLKSARKVTNPVHRSKSRTLSFRSELANRIKRTTLGRFQAQSMFDLRSDDGLEVGMLYENLLDDGDISEEDSDSEGLDDFSVQSDSTLSLADDMHSSIYSLQRTNAVESLDLAGVGSDGAKSKPQSSTPQASSSSVTCEVNTKSNTEPKPKKNPPKLDPRKLGKPEKSLTPPPSPRIASIRAHTMRKTSTSNAVMVLSGGDGYWDMHTGGNFSKNEDASLLFWIYKF